MESEAGPDLIFEISVDPSTGSYVATARTFAIIATANSMQELRINALEAVDDYFDESMPQPTLVHFLYAAGDMLME